MIKKLKTSGHASREILISEEIHFRLCHICLKLNESEEEIVECESCQCPYTDDGTWDIAPYNQRSLGGNSAILKEELSEDDEEFTPSDAYARKARRLMGLTVRW